MKKLFSILKNKHISKVLTPLEALKSVISSTDKGVYASSGTLFKGAIFGRDSLEVAEDLMKINPKLVRHILITLASLQGLHSSNINEEDHGKIIHEYRNTLIDGKHLDSVSRKIFNELSSRWGGNNREMAYYGSIDATPQFIRVVGLYCQLVDNNIMDNPITRRDGKSVLFGQTVSNAIDWITKKLANSSSGLLEYHSRNPKGIENQVWKDSREFYVHKNGQLANRHQPIASIEVQGLAYDALIYGARLFPMRAKELIKHAKKLQKRTFDLLWLKDEQYFALGLDYSPKGLIRPIKTITANPAELLNTCLFDNLPRIKSKKYICQIVRQIMNTDFLTDGGVRSRSLKESKLIKFWDYHGSFTSWPKETYDIAKGLRRQGFLRLAEQLENRILNVVHKSHSYPEFIYVNESGKVMIGDPTTKTHGELSLIKSTNKPETIQAWTVASIVDIDYTRKHHANMPIKHQKQWQKRLENQILSDIPDIQPIQNPEQLDALYPDYQYKLIKY